MSRMFEQCTGLTSLTLGSFDTSNVTTMKEMFYGDSSLTSINVNNWDTSKVIDMSKMFYGCSNLTSLDLSSFDTKNVTNMSGMFYNCRGVTSHHISMLDTSKVTNMGYMFYKCPKLKTVDFSGLDTGLVTTMRCMFYECKRLHEIAGLSDFDTGSDIQSMDGYSPPIFLDMGDTYDHICKDSALLASFHEQLARTVPWKSWTSTYYSAIDGYHDIHHFSGMTCSEVSTNPRATDSYKTTEWYQATH